MERRALVPRAPWGASQLPNYRLYQLDGAGRIDAAEWIDAVDDDDARGKARARARSGQYELWEGKRLVEQTGRPEV